MHRPAEAGVPDGLNCQSHLIEHAFASRRPPELQLAQVHMPVPALSDLTRPAGQAARSGRPQDHSPGPLTANAGPGVNIQART